MIKKALLIFVKNPEVGKVKTRLAATIGDEAALAIYQQLLLYTASATEYLVVDKFVFYSGHKEEEDIWNNKHFFKEVQHGNDLGERMKNAFSITFGKGYERVVIIGSDCPDITEVRIESAFSELDSAEVVMGPTEDGGYYLMGMKKLYPELFENMRWSTNHVFPDTIRKCEDLHLTYSLLPVLNDIDEMKDLIEFQIQKQSKKN